MEMAVMVDKEELIELYACCRQAQMSLHRVLPFGDVWGEFQEFYNMQRRALLTQQIEKLRAIIAPDTPTISLPQIMKSARWLNLLSPVKAMRNRRQESIGVAPKYAKFIGASLQRFSEFIDRSPRPATNEIIEMRRELYAAEWILGVHLSGLKQVATAKSVEHFNQSDYRRHVAIEEIAAPASRLAKKSA